MRDAFPGLAQIQAIGSKPEVTAADWEAIKAILRTWSTPSLAMLHRALSR